MLILSRRKGRRILLSDDIAIEVFEVSGGTVRLGIEAPARVRVYRAELLDADQENPPPTDALTHTEAAPRGD